MKNTKELCPDCNRPFDECVENGCDYSANNEFIFTFGEFTIDEPRYVKGYGWNVTITHKNHKGYFAEVSGNTEQEAINNARLFVNAYRMYNSLKRIHKEDIYKYGTGCPPQRTVEIARILNDIER